MKNLISSGASGNIITRKRELSPEEEQILEKNLVWLFGSPRSGTSWVALQLLSHNTHSINEPHLNEHLSKERRVRGEPVVRTMDVFRDLNNYIFSDSYKKNWSHFLRKLILNRIYAQVNDISKKIIIKEPGSAGAAELILECFPNSKMILLFRDGRDVIDSFVDALRKDGFITKESGATPITDKERLNFITGRCRAWVRLVQNMMNTVKANTKESCFITKYEDLRRDTFPEIKKIYEFIDVQIGDDELREIIDKYDFKRIPKQNTGSGKFHRSASPGKWRENFTEDEKVVMETIMGETLRKLDYSTDVPDKIHSNYYENLRKGITSTNNQHMHTDSKVKELTKEEEHVLEKNIIWIFEKDEKHADKQIQPIQDESTLKIDSFHISDHLAVQVYAIKDRVVRRIDHLKHDPAYFFSDAHKDTWQYYLRKLILNRIYAQVNDISKKIRIYDINPINTSDIILECFPNSTIVDKNN